MRPRLTLPIAAALALSCQDYPFEVREPKRVDARKINEVVATLRPVDVLFVIDNSETMNEERQSLIENVAGFVEELAATDVDFQIGIVTPDVECNLPTRLCQTPGGTSIACCLTVGVGAPLCQDADVDGDTQLDSTTCDGGRLRGPGTDLTALTAPQRRIFSLPDNASSADRAQLVDDLSATLENVGCKGSGFESGFEAVRRAVGCSTGVDCLDPSVGELNAGFIREDADLVLIFITDEDDCSFVDDTAYLRPFNASDPSEQVAKLCSPDECYGYLGDDSDGDQQIDWAEPSFGVRNYFKCRSLESGADVNRQVSPPVPDTIDAYLNIIVGMKGSLERVRAAGILSSRAESGASLGFVEAGCFRSVTGPSANCGCLATRTSNLFCEITGMSNLIDVRSGDHSLAATETCTGQPISIQDGCQAMPSGRYMQFLSALAVRREQAGFPSDVLVDTICKADYQDTLFNIVNNVILSSCFDVGDVAVSGENIQVRLNGEIVPQVEANSQFEGWSLSPSATQICLEGGLQKSYNDRFEIYVVDASSQ